MSKNVDDLAFKLSGQYDGAGLKLAFSDLSSFRDMLKQMPTEQADGMKSLASKSRDMGQSGGKTDMSEFRRSFVEEENNRRLMMDREYWAARGRLRDADVAKEIASHKRATTEYILETVRRQQADASAQRMFVFDANRPLNIPDGTRGKFGGGNLGSTTADNNMNNRGFVGAMAIQQMGFAVQDFSSQMTNAKTTADGLGRGVMAVSNNVQMLGAAFGPTGLAVTAIGGAVAGIVLPPMIRWVYQADLLKESIAEAKEEAREYAAELRRASEQQDQKTAALPGMTTKEFEAMRADRMKSAKADMQQTEAELAAQTQIIEREERKRAASINRSAWGSTVADLFTGTSPEQMAAHDKRNELREQLNDQRDYFTQLEHVSGETTKRLAENDYELQRKKKEADTKAAQDRLDQYDRDMQHEKEFNDWVMNTKLQAENEKQFALSENLDAMRKLDQTPNGSSAANVRGTGAAVSAINRAIAGTNSEESDRKKQIKVLEDQLKVSQNIERKLNLQRAAL